jgi:CRP-like cAMP-binding protein
MIDKSELRRIPTFEGLPDDQLDWFISQTEEIRLKPGDVYLQLGDLASSMVVILEGELQARGDINGETFVIPFAAGSVTGVLPFSRMKKSVVTG